MIQPVLEFTKYEETLTWPGLWPWGVKVSRVSDPHFCFVLWRQGLTVYAQATLDLETDPLAQLPECGIAGVHHQTQPQTFFWGGGAAFSSIGTSYSVAHMPHRET